jgi:hypothetical protein
MIIARYSPEGNWASHKVVIALSVLDSSDISHLETANAWPHIGEE